jgi:mannitol-1-phosphate 5-dehydrogenase
VSLNGGRTFVGFGFGPIQAGLFLYEAFRSGNYGRLVVAEVAPDLVRSVRQARGFFSVNIAHFDRRETVAIGPVEILDPGSNQDRCVLIEAVSQAQEIATAVPSVQSYVSRGCSSLHNILGEGLREKARAHLPRAVVYAAENHNRAAEILESEVLAVIPADEQSEVQSSVRFLNTVVGKMSGVVTVPEEIRKQGLAEITPFQPRAFLVEAFNRILISQICFPGEPPFQRGIAVFDEKPDLLPFEEAKLYGHNATHALAAFVGAVLGVRRISELPEFPGVLPFLEAAFTLESGKTLIRRHGGADPLFTPEGYREYALDLIARMTNPFLLDTVERVGRDPGRKLGWEDRLLGTMRIALRHGVWPRRYAFGAAAALAALNPTLLETEVPASAALDPLWAESSHDPLERQAALGCIEEGRGMLKLWMRDGFPDLEERFGGQ